MTRAITLLVFLLLVASLALAQDPRYGGPPERDADGSIKRSRAVLREFQRIHPCPSTGLQSGSCPRWHLDHVVPLSCGGADAIFNLQWLPVELKSCRGALCKDRWERRVYCRFITQTTTPKDHP